MSTIWSRSSIQTGGRPGLNWGCQEFRRRNPCQPAADDHHPDNLAKIPFIRFPGSSCPPEAAGLPDQREHRRPRRVQELSGMRITRLNCCPSAPFRPRRCGRASGSRRPRRRAAAGSSSEPSRSAIVRATRSTLSCARAERPSSSIAALRRPSASGFSVQILPHLPRRHPAVDGRALRRRTARPGGRGPRAPRPAARPRSGRAAPRPAG